MIARAFGRLPDTDLTVVADARYSWGLSDALESSDAKTGTWVFRARSEYLFHRLFYPADRWPTNRLHMS